jgi:hypothetical protein
MNKDEALKLAMDFVASISPAFICEATHHKKNERHADNEPCPHVKKQKQTYEAIKKALANEALEKKAENARELGLNYEPEPVAETMRQMLEVQGQHGNWNYDSYMHGLYNGMEYMVALAEKREPKFRDAPEIWLAKYEVKRDNFNSTEPLTESTEVKHD